MRHRLLLNGLCVAALLATGPAARAGIEIEISGLDDDLLENVNQRLGIRAAARRKDLDVAIVEALHRDAFDPRRPAAVRLPR